LAPSSSWNTIFRMTEKPSGVSLLMPKAAINPIFSFQDVS
jgi:hypothetical protein